MLREHLGLRSAKDGCSPQGQCGCCTVWVDGAPRVACVTPVRRLAGRAVTTLEGLDATTRDAWAGALCATGGSQCGFCTPGIVLRLAALDPPPPEEVRARVDRALVAHLCRCTGWQTVAEAAALVWSSAPGDAPGDAPVRDLAAAARRAGLEGGATQRVGPEVALGRGGFADDGAPADALVAVPDGGGGYVVADTLAAARARAAAVPGRNTTVPPVPPVPLPDGSWAVTLRTPWVEPAYLEPDASWCAPGGDPASPLGNGGAFGGKRTSPVADDAARLAAEHGRPVRVVWSRPDVVRRGPKRPPVAVGVDAGGRGVLRVGVPPGGLPGGAWEALVGAVATVAPGLVPEPHEVVGPPIGTGLRAAGWAEAAVVAAAVGAGGRPGSPVTGVPVRVVAPAGGSAVATCRADGSLLVEVDAGEPLDATVVRAFVVGAAHQAVSWVRTEGLAVDDAGEPLDLTVRSFGILPARAMPPVEVVVADGGGPPVNASDAAFAAVAAACWLADGLPPEWPTDRDGAGRP